MVDNDVPDLLDHSEPPPDPNVASDAETQELIDYLSSLKVPEGGPKVPRIVNGSDVTSPAVIVYEHPSGSTVHFSVEKCLRTDSFYGAARLDDFEEVSDGSSQKNRRHKLLVTVFCDGEDHLREIISLVKAGSIHHGFGGTVEKGAIYSRVIDLDRTSFVCRWATVTLDGATSYSLLEKYNETFGSFNCNHQDAPEVIGSPFRQCAQMFNVCKPGSSYDPSKELKLMHGFSGLCSAFIVDIREVLGTTRIKSDDKDAADTFEYVLRIRLIGGLSNFLVTSTCADPYKYSEYLSIDPCDDHSDVIGHFEGDIEVVQQRNIKDSFLSSIGVEITR